MADFRKACDFVLQNEDSTLSGAITADPTKDDPTARARFGVNSASHPDAVRQGFFEMGRADALQYAEDTFKYDYFNQVGGYQIADQGICNKLCDLAFNAGVHQSAKIVQRALQDIEDWDPAVEVDGICGSRTVALINASPAATLLTAIKEQAKDFYRAIVAANPEKQKYLDAWISRVDR
jgi:lysozyme family protein